MEVAPSMNAIQSSPCEQQDPGDCGEIGAEDSSPRPHERAAAGHSMLIERALRLNPAFSGWSTLAIERLLSRAVLKSYRKGSSIAAEAHERSDILVIVSGYMLMSRRTPDGCTHSVGIVGPGRIVSTQCKFNLGLRLELAYSAHEDAMVIHVGHEELFDLLRDVPRLWRSVGAAVLTQQREFLETVVDQNRGSASQRVANLIFRFSKLYGMPLGQDGSMQLRIRLSQADLAALLRLSRQTINETLREFRESGWIRSDSNVITILDREALFNRARTEPLSSRISGSHRAGERPLRRLASDVGHPGETKEVWTSTHSDRSRSAVPPGVGNGYREKRN